ncbi:MAG TPA: adenylate/guanylate cyclase domain-containing protein [Methylomirabilota bacterium]|jgi:adenylate cyclase
MSPTRRLRLSTGLVLFTYVTTHFVNHALGLVSLDAMEAGRDWFLGFWRSAVGSVLLYGSLLTHVALAFWALYDRRTLRMPLWETTQLALGLCIPPLLIGHIFGTRITWALYGVEDAYSRLALTLWAITPELGRKQILILVVVWAHAMIGLHANAKLRPWYPRAAPWLLAFAVLVPVLAVLGFIDAGRQAAALARDPAVRAELLWHGREPLTAAEAARVRAMRDTTLTTYSVLLAAVFVARGVRGVVQRRRRRITIVYPDNRRVAVPAGLSVLEVSRLARIPHASVCGGRGRCSTCRVRIHSAAPQPGPHEAEARVLARLGAPGDVRLACQLRPTSDLLVVPLLPATATAADGRAGDVHNGREQEIAVLFADLRGFTRLAEHRLPYDVVFFLNRYFEAVGGAIQRAGGVANQYTGDGVMALFGLEADPVDGCRHALAAAAEMVRSVSQLSQALAADLGEPLRLGIGIHTGPAVVGHMGYGAAVYLTAVGDTVHVAARLEALTKEYDCELVISEAVARRAGVPTPGLPRHELTLRNRREPLVVFVVREAAAVAPGLSNAGVSETRH